MKIAECRRFTPRPSRKTGGRRPNSMPLHHHLPNRQTQALYRHRFLPICMYPIRTLTARQTTNRIAARVTNLAPRASFTSAGRHDPSVPSVNPGRPTTVNKIQAQSRSGQISAHFSSTTSSPSSKQQEHRSSSTDTMASATLPTRGGYDPKAPEKFTSRKIGAPHTLEHRIYIEKDGVPVSPFHDIPLYANEQQSVLNMVVEIPRWTNAKQEVRFYIH